MLRRHCPNSKKLIPLSYPLKLDIRLPWDKTGLEIARTIKEAYRENRNHLTIELSQTPLNTVKRLFTVWGEPFLDERGRVTIEVITSLACRICSEVR